MPTLQEPTYGNHFDRWVAGPGARYFEVEPPFGKGGQGGFADQLDAIRMRAASRGRHGAMFTWEKVLGEYEDLLSSGSRFKGQGSS